jgi:GrpB-like predicted nucleotidyltransferase (UPF0157 family)
LLLGLHSGEVRLALDHAAWAEEFLRERERILAAVGAQVCGVEHVGSTALPGVPAKPILDLLVGVENFEAARVCVAPLEALGYEYRGEYGIARRHYFVKGMPRTHHLHMHEVASEAWRSQLGFRDALRADPQLARHYAEAKTRLAAMHGRDREGYQAAKDEVIGAMLAAWR